jgi:hypothetical protein
LMARLLLRGLNAGSAGAGSQGGLVDAPSSVVLPTTLVRRASA